MRKSRSELIFCTPNEHSRRAAAVFLQRIPATGGREGKIFPGSISDENGDRIDSMRLKAFCAEQIDA